MASTLSAGKKALFTLIFIVLSASLVFLVGELVVRSMGHSPWQPPLRTTTVSPGSTFFQPDSLLGYAHQPGVFALTLNQQLSFTATLNSSGHRITHSSERETKAEAQNSWWILGGSFTFGWGVADEEAFPSQVATAVPAIRVENFGVGGYGTLQSLYQFKQALYSGEFPETVVLAYASFHDQRNTCNRYWLKAIAPHTVLKELVFPTARLLGDSLTYGFEAVQYHPIPGSRWSALMNFWDDQRNKRQEEALKSNSVSRKLIAAMASLCKKQHLRFILAGIDGDEVTQQTLSYFADQGIETVDISVDLTLEGNNLLPVDPHPSARVHREYAKRLLEMQ